MCRFELLKEISTSQGRIKDDMNDYGTACMTNDGKKVIAGVHADVHVYDTSSGEELGM